MIVNAHVIKQVGKKSKKANNSILGIVTKHPFSIGCYCKGTRTSFTYK